MSSQQFLSYNCVAPHSTLADVIQERVPEAAALSEAECLKLVEEAKTKAPESVKSGSRIGRAQWIVRYIRKKVRA